MSKTTTYTATDPETGDVFTRSTERATGYAFAVIIRDLREGEQTHHWAEWAARRDLADKNAASWNAKRGMSRRDRYGYQYNYGPGYRAIVVPAVRVLSTTERAAQNAAALAVADAIVAPVPSEPSWDAVQLNLRGGTYGDWSLIRHCLCAVEAARYPDQGIGSSDINHMAFAWVRSGADLVGLVRDAMVAV